MAAENVTELMISLNQLSGTYPRGWVLPPGLRVLNLYSNRLTGTLDPAWAFPPTLQALALNENQFRGTIPGNWTLPDSLQVGGQDGLLRLGGVCPVCTLRVASQDSLLLLRLVCPDLRAQGCRGYSKRLAAGHGIGGVDPEMCMGRVLLLE